MNKYKFEDLYLGLKEEFDVVVTEEKMKQFENLSGDINPLHINEEYASEKFGGGRSVWNAYIFFLFNIGRSSFTWRKMSFTRNRYQL